MAAKIVINLEGGLIRRIYSDDPEVEVHVFDWDAYDSEYKDWKGRTENERAFEYRSEVKGLKEVEFDI